MAEVRGLARWLWLQLLLIGTVTTAMAQQDLTPSPAAELRTLINEAWEKDMRDDPLRASYLGDRRFESEWPDVSLAALDDATPRTLRS